MPPMPKEKMKLSISNPVVRAKSKRLGGLQYAGTKIGSVKPKGIVNRLAHAMTFRCWGNVTYAASHGTRNALDHTNHTYWSEIISRFAIADFTSRCGLPSTPSPVQPIVDRTVHQASIDTVKKALDKAEQEAPPGEP